MATVPTLYEELSLTAQTAYAEVFDAARAIELRRAVGTLNGSFASKTVKGRTYWYFQYRDINGAVRQLYVGPDDEKVRGLVSNAPGGNARLLEPRARSALALGNQGILPRHFRIIRRLSEYGFFHAGGMLVGTHAFLAYGNLLGVRWLEGSRTQDIDFAHAGKNISIALPASIEVDTRAAIDSLKMGFLPASALSGAAGATFLNPKEPDLRIDFLTTRGRSDHPVRLPSLHVTAQPLRFIELLLEHPVQVALLGESGAVVVNVPAPARYAVHKLIVSTERESQFRTKANKDLLQAAALVSYMQDHMSEEIVKAWQDVDRRGPSWRKKASQGRAALRKLLPALHLSSVAGR